jgi:hypothetical protein
MMGGDRARVRWVNMGGSHVGAMRPSGERGFAGGMLRRVVGHMSDEGAGGRPTVFGIAAMSGLMWESLAFHSRGN